MSKSILTIANGQVASLHLHPKNPDDGLQSVASIDLVAEKGIRDDHRYFGRVSRSTGKPSRRQVSLTERERIAEHAAALGMGAIPAGDIRSNIETMGIDLISLIGRQVAVGEAILYFYEARTPCHKMDKLCQGLRERMENNRQGVMAEVIRSGSVRVGDSVIPIPAPAV